MSKRLQVFQRSEGKCAFCGTPLDITDFTWDHVTPRSFGGSDNTLNLVAACRHCNLRKSDMSVEEYREAYRLGEFWIEKLEGKKLRGHSNMVWREITVG